VNKHCATTASVGPASDYDNGAGDLLHEFAWRQADERGDEIALLFGDGTAATFAELAQEARDIATALARLGLNAGETVSFILPNWREAIPITIAASALGLVVNPIIPIYREAECLHILGDARARVLFTVEAWRGYDYRSMAERLQSQLPHLARVILVRSDSGGASGYDEFRSDGAAALAREGLALRPVDPNSTKMLLYTSGTTGRAKGVLHTHSSLSAARRAISDYWGLGPGDVMFMPSPVTHVTGYMMGIEFPFFTGGKSALMARWDAQYAVEYVSAVGATTTVGATPFLQELLNASQEIGADLPSLRLFACGGASVPPDLIRRANSAWRRCRTFRIYGSTEAPGVTSGWIEPEHASLAADTDGRVRGWDVKILSADLEDVPLGQEGEIVVKGPGLFVGYHDPADNVGAFTDDDYFRTGDLGRLTSDGAIVVTGRLKDLIIRGGENLSAKEIEDVLHRHPAIAEAAVVSMPHERLGEGVCAFVVLRTGADVPTLKGIAGFVEDEGLAKQKIPEALVVVTEFPRTASGKVRKDLLRAEARRQQTAAAAIA